MASLSCGLGFCPSMPSAVRNSHAHNVSRLRLASNGSGRVGHLGIFPAGTVSHLQLRKGCIADPTWHKTVAGLVRRTGATVLTMFFDGHNSMVFQLSGLIHPKLRTALLPSELVKRTHSRVAVRIGRPIEPHKVARYSDDRTLTSYLRFKTYMLKWRESPIRPRFAATRRRDDGAARGGAAAQPCNLAAEVSRLPSRRFSPSRASIKSFSRALTSMPFAARRNRPVARANFPGRWRGDRAACDVDRFDQHYQHLFPVELGLSRGGWQLPLGKVDEILKEQGADGPLYEHAVQAQTRPLESAWPALEMGRSFVRQEYQGQAIPLALIWRGIGEYLVRNPTYKVLFGPVSISKEYEGFSRRLMVEFLSQALWSRKARPLVKPRNPLRDRLSRQEREALAALVRDADDVSALVSEIEADRKGLPILLRHYLRLNAFLLSFNLDASFGNCIDGLIVVDLRTAEPKLLRRYLGDAGYESYMRVPGPTPVLSLRTRS
jgi:putative hemolysin